MDMANSQENPEIVVPAWSRRYVAAVAELLDIEGGFVDDPADHGGATKYGISLRFLKAEGAFDQDGDGFAEFDLNFDGDIDGLDIRALTKADARVLYHRCFWLKVGAEQLPAPLGEALFDQAVNGGLTAAGKLLQRAVNHCLMEAAKIGATPPALLKVDGAIGRTTLDAVLWVLRYPGQGMARLIEAYRDAVRERYRQIAARFPSQKKFLRGWLARAERLGR